MQRTPWLFGFLTLISISACGGNKGDNAAAGGSGTESGTMQGGATTRTDTGMARADTTGGGMSGMSSDTAKGAAGTWDSTKAHQTHSGPDSGASHQ